MDITFMGATETVTGSKYLLEVENKKIMVDCGLFQGLKELRLKNWENPPVKPSQVDAIILTHAHIDHTGYLPRFAKLGFKGKIYCTPATQELCEILLLDSAHLQEEEAERANLLGYSKHHPALPLYTREDAVNVLKQFQPLSFGKDKQLFPEFKFQFQHAGHILGASFIHIENNGTSLLFSGDMGRFNDAVMHRPAFIQSIDYLVLESTYGNRVHKPVDPIDELEEVINTTVNRGGTVIIPAFAVGRAQNIMYYIHRLKKENRIANIPVYLDSPMAVSASELFCKYHNEHHLSKDLARFVCDSIAYTESVEDSMALAHQHVPMIIISASGMIAGGRVLHHIKTFGGDPKNTILLSDYQAAGTRGAQILKGERKMKLLGEEVVINAQICSLSGASAHADQSEILNWLSHFTSPPRKIFLTHGEPESQRALADKIEEIYGWHVIIPRYLQRESLI